MHRFQGRTALVTGGAHGIGLATAHRLIDEGARVAIADVDEAAMAQALADHRGPPEAMIGIRCDVTDPVSVDRAVAECVRGLGALDVLVHTAGGESGPSDDLADDSWQHALDFNLVGTVRCLRAALPHLIASRFGGNAVVIGSVNGLLPLGSYPYSAAKAGLGILIANLAAEHGPRGVRFNLVAPGTVRTRVWDDQPDSLRRMAALYPLGRVAEPADIAAAVAFLASDDAAWITGITLPVDGGLLTRGLLPPREA
jgi:NAD(P)-dependent dehydrogenase (short-subunit alcohol dehydrogenase family)